MALDCFDSVAVQEYKVFISKEAFTLHLTKYISEDEQSFTSLM
jgi:hypothetical protein